MSRPWGSDLISVMKGLENVIKAGIHLQEHRLKQIWLTSSIRNINEELCNISINTGKKILDDPAIVKNTTKKVINESIGRSSAVLAGFKELTRYTSGRGYFSANEVSPEKAVSKSSTANLTDMNKDLNRPKISIEEIQFSAVNKGKNDDGLMYNEEIKGNIEKQNIRPLSSHTIDFINPEVSWSSDSSIKQDKETTHESAVAISPKVQQQQLNSRARQRRVPASRFARLISFGGLAAGLGFGTAAELARRTLERTVGKSDQSSTSVNSEKLVPSAASLFLTQANAERIVNTLCKVRGAALKIGQILSIQDNNIVSPELQSAFERVRQAADFMPIWQVKKVMTQEFGPDWESKLASFEETPFAAASIGQVHLATLHDGRQVAMKIQYPGVAQGIDSDIDNLVSVLKVWKIFPDGMFIDNVVKVAKRELAWEVDYEREAECAKKFQELLKPYPDYVVPTVIDELSTKQVYTTELVNGIPIDKCVELDRSTREHVCLLIMCLCLKELFSFYYMQTDPNWANFFYDTRTNKLALLDFGATRSYEKAFMDKYIQVIKAAADGNRDDVLSISQEMGFLTGYESKAMEAAHVDAVMILGEVFGTGGFDFAAQNTTLRLQRLIPTIVTERLCPPPEEIYSLHRKLSGVFLLCAKLQVNINCRDLFEEIWNKYQFD